MYLFLLVLHMVGLTMSVGTGFSMLALGISTKGMELSERAKFMLRAFVLSRVGAIGLALLLISGLGMLFVDMSTVMVRGGHFFHIKLTLVVIIIGLFGFMQVLIKKAKQNNGGPVMSKIPKVGQLMLFLSLLTVVFAVLAFK